MPKKFTGTVCSKFSSEDFEQFCSVSSRLDIPHGNLLRKIAREWLQVNAATILNNDAAFYVPRKANSVNLTPKSETDTSIGAR